MTLPLDLFGELLSVGSGIAGLFSSFSGGDLPDDISDALQLNKKIAKALVDPTQPMFANLVDQQEAEIRANYAEALRNLQVSQNRALARGTSTINPERRDEAIAGTMSRAFDESRQQAQANARAFLQAAAGVNAAALGGAPVYAQLATQNAQQQRFAGGLEGIFDIGQALLNGNPDQAGAKNAATLKMLNDAALPQISGGYSYYGGPR